MEELKLVKEPKYGKVGILGESTTVGHVWLQHQEVKFARDAEFVSMYPLEGGAMVCDLNEIEHLGAPSDKDLDQVLCRNGGFNPAAETIEKMMEK